MAIRRQRLHHRIMMQGADMSTAMGAAHPGPNAIAGTPLVMPVTLVTVTPGVLVTADGAPIPTAQGGQWPAGGGGTADTAAIPEPTVTLGVSDVDPLITADGAVVPSTGPGRWDQLRAAGRP